MNFYKHYIGDYARDTSHLSMLEHAAYRLLLDHYYATEQKLPMPAQCERICRASNDEERAAVRSVLSQFFKNGLNGRAEKEIKEYKDYSNAQAMRAHMRWHKQAQSVGNANHSHSHKEENKTNPPPDGGNVWDLGKNLLHEQGLSLSSAGALIGSWLRDWPEAEVAEAIRAAAGKADVRSYVAAILKTKAKKGQQQASAPSRVAL